MRAQVISAPKEEINLPCANIVQDVLIIPELLDGYWKSGLVDGWVNEEVSIGRKGGRVNTICGSQSLLYQNIYNRSIWLSTS